MSEGVLMSVGTLCSGDFTNGTADPATGNSATESAITVAIIVRISRIAVSSPIA